MLRVLLIRENIFNSPGRVIKKLYKFSKPYQQDSSGRRRANGGPTVRCERKLNNSVVNVSKEIEDNRRKKNNLGHYYTVG